MILSLFVWGVASMDNRVLLFGIDFVNDLVFNPRIFLCHRIFESAFGDHSAKMKETFCNKCGPILEG